MTYYGPLEIARSFRTVRGNTIQAAEEIAEEQYGFRPADGTRTVAELLTHIAFSNTFNHQMHAVEKRTTVEGFDFVSLMEQIRAEEARPRSKAEIVDLLRSRGEEWAGYLEGLSEDFLSEQVRMMPGTEPASKSRFEMLIAPKEHEMHHRGQLMLIQRMLGLVPHLTRQMQERMAAMQQKSAQ
jgi:uncharacterized damage-inducible protein DinB